MANIKTLVSGILLAVIALILVMELYAGTVGDVQDAGDEVNGTGAPLANLFEGDGVIILLFMASGVLAAINLTMNIVK